MNYIFYDTKNFEVYCFCPISIYDNTMIIKNAESKKENTDYFLVGGFDNNKKKGIIKLYKVNYGIEYDKTTIEYIQDIIFANENNNMKGFRGPISSITQSNIDGKILVTCWDGNVYELDKPKIEDYINYDEQFKQNISFNNFFGISN